MEYTKQCEDLLRMFAVIVHNSPVTIYRGKNGAEMYKRCEAAYCMDYIKKTFVVNDGSEIPKYYAQSSHPAIVSAAVFDLMQMELERRRSLKGNYSGKAVLSRASYFLPNG